MRSLATPDRRTATRARRQAPGGKHSRSAGASFRHRALPAVRFVLIAVAAAGVFAPLPAEVVERYYSTGVYPFVQRGLTSASNLGSFAAFDALILGGSAWWIAAFGLDVMRRHAWGRIAFRLILRTTTLAAALYLLFLAAWGLNYQRVPLPEKLQFDPGAVSAASARELALKAVGEVNALYARARAGGTSGAVDPSLPNAFLRAQRDLGLSRTARPARPKRSMLDWYFRNAGVDGMTDPYFLETLVVSNLLPFERPFVVAHEWSHLAGFSDEGEANFVGWLTCLRGSEAAQYSGWLFLYREVAGALSRDDRAHLAVRLGPGPRADLQAIANRLAQNVSPKMSAAGWEVYDRYLRANRVEAGTASYAEVVRLALGVRFSPDGVPLRR